MTQAAATILMLDLPPKTFVGINLISFNSSPKFHGITKIPPGRHLLYTGTDASLSIRHGQWLEVSSGPHDQQPGFVAKWSHEHEALQLLAPSSEDAQAAFRATSVLGERALVDYSALCEATSNLRSSESSQSDSDRRSQSQDDPWPALTSYITSTTLSRILAPHGTSETESRAGTKLTQQSAWILSSISSSPQDTESIPGLTKSESASFLEDNAVSPPLNFMPINLKQTWPAGSFGRDRTEKARDRSWYLNQLISLVSSPDKSESGQKVDANEREGKRKQTGAKELLAELQFTFVAVLTLANYSALEQWKRLLSVLLSSKTAISEVELFFVEVIKVLQTQLQRVDDVEGGLFEMSDEVGSAWLRSLLRGFRMTVDDIFHDQNDKQKGETRDGLRSRLGELELWLRDQYGWADEGAILKRGMLDLEDGERVELEVDGVDEEEESGEYAPVVVEM